MFDLKELLTKFKEAFAKNWSDTNTRIRNLRHVKDTVDNEEAIKHLDTMVENEKKNKKSLEEVIDKIDNILGKLDQ